MNDLDSIETEEKVSFVSYQLALVPWEDFVQLDEKYAFQMVLTWYMSIVVFGWFGINILHVFLISCMAKGQATDVRYDYEEEVKRTQGKDTPIDPKRKRYGLNCATCMCIPRPSVDVAADAIFTIEILKRPQDFPPLSLEPNDVT